MDKSIEERAKEYKKRYFSKANDLFQSVAKVAYIVGAEEQKAIDIDKACQWFGEYLMDIGYPDDWYRDSLVQMSGEERFRKAMEEEL